MINDNVRAILEDKSLDKYNPKDEPQELVEVSQETIDRINAARKARFDKAQADEQAKREKNQKAVIYARVSPTRHIRTASDMHQSLEEAIKICTNAIERDSNQLVRIYKDEYISGKQSKLMPQFQQMLKDARAGKIERIYTRRVNRFGRNRADMITAEIELSSLGIPIIFVEQGLATDTPHGKSIMGFYAESAQQEREEILANTQRGREEAMLRGVKFGRKEKKINVERVRQLRLLPVNSRPTWDEMEDMFSCTKQSMLNKLKRAGYWDKDKGCVI